MNSIDKRNILDKEIFKYKITKDKKVLISYKGKQIKILANEKARAFIEDIDGLSGREEQLVLAKVTGNFKRGNEKKY